MEPEVSASDGVATSCPKSDETADRDGRLQDVEDYQNAKEDTGDEAPKPWWKCIGPGLVTGAADDDPSGIGTYSVAGAQFGYGMLWMVPFSIPFMIAVQEMCGRVGIVTGKGIAAVLKEHYSKWLMLGCVSLLVVANVINIYADLNVMAASAVMLFHGPNVLWLTLIASFIVVVQIIVPYRYYVKFLKWLCLALVSYAVVALMPGVHNNWAQIVQHSFIPSWSKQPAYLMTAVGLLGTTISPYLFFWQAGQEVEEEIAGGVADRPGHRTKRVSSEEIRKLRADTVVGMIASQVVCFFIIICTAATLHAHGKTDINTARDAADALRPLGKSAYWLFTLGILGTGMLAIPTLAGSAGYAVSEAVGWKYGLYRRLGRAKGFYGVVAGMTIVGFLLNFARAIDPVKSLIYAAVVNGVVAVPLLIVLLCICNNRSIVKDKVNGAASNVFGWLTIAFMGVAAIALIWGVVTGKA